MRAMMKLAMIGLVGAIGVAPAYAQPPSLFKHGVTVQQDGKNNQAAARQFGLGNIAKILQKGDANTGQTTQSGNNNYATVRQIGKGNDGAITQTGSDNTACLVQVGRRLDGEIVQTGGQSTGVIQTRKGSAEFPAELCMVHDVTTAYWQKLSRKAR